MNLMGNGAFLERNMDQMFLCLLEGFRNGDGHFRGLPLSDADPALPVSHDDKRTKIKPFAALDDLGNPVNEHDLILEAEFVRIYSHAIRLLLAMFSNDRS